MLSRAWGIGRRGLQIVSRDPEDMWTQLFARNIRLCRAHPAVARDTPVGVLPIDDLVVVLQFGANVSVRRRQVHA